jgi:hypothetical protein
MSFAITTLVVRAVANGTTTYAGPVRLDEITFDT